MKDQDKNEDIKTIVWPPKAQDPKNQEHYEEQEADDVFDKFLERLGL